MKAYVLSEDGPRLVSRPPPSPRPTELLIRVRAAALNRVDLAMAQGHVHGTAGGVGNVLGVEWAGEVEATGAEVSGFRAGDRVMCAGAGGFAELAVVDSARALPVPANMDLVQAAALPVALQTMHDALVSQGQLSKGQAVLVQGASSGVGLMAMQLAKLLGARWVAGSSSDTGRRARLAEFGADFAFDAHAPDWVEQVLAATDGKGVDLTIDQVAGPLARANMQATRVQGRIVNVGRLGGMRAEFDFDLHALRRITYVGVTFRTRSREELRKVTEGCRRDLWEALQQGRIALPVERVFPLDQLTEALDHMRGNHHFGKLVVTPTNG